MDNLEAERAAKGWGGYTFSGSVLGGGVTAVGGTVVALVKGLRGDKTGYYKATIGAYRGTLGTSNAFFGDVSLCQRLFTKIADIKSMILLKKEAAWQASKSAPAPQTIVGKVSKWLDDHLDSEPMPGFKGDAQASVASSAK